MEQKNWREQIEVIGLTGYLKGPPLWARNIVGLIFAAPALTKSAL
jgi:hypothetical protein